MLLMDPHKDYCPLILNAATFELFLHYLMTKKKKTGRDLYVQAYDGGLSALMHMFWHSKHTCFEYFTDHIGDLS